MFDLEEDFFSSVQFAMPDQDNGSQSQDDDTGSGTGTD